MFAKLLIGALFILAALAIIGRSKRTDEFPTKDQPPPHLPGEDLVHCPKCDRYVPKGQKCCTGDSNTSPE